MFNVNRRNNQFLYEDNFLAVIPGAYELTEIAELKKEETECNVIIEPDNNAMKCLMEVKRGSLNFDVDKLIAPLVVFKKIVYEQGMYASQKIIDNMGFSTINIHYNVISGVKDNGNNTDTL